MDRALAVATSRIRYIYIYMYNAIYLCMHAIWKAMYIQLFAAAQGSLKTTTKLSRSLRNDFRCD